MATWAQPGMSFIPQQGSGPMGDQQGNGQSMMMPMAPMNGGDCSQQQQQQGNAQQSMMMMPACMPMQSGGSNGMQPMMMMPMQMQGMNGQQPMMMPMQMQGMSGQQPMMMPMQNMQAMQPGGGQPMMMMMMVPQNGQMMMQPMMMMQPAMNGQQQQQQQQQQPLQQPVDVDSGAPSTSSEATEKQTPAGPPGAFAPSTSSKQPKTSVRDKDEHRNTQDAKSAALTAGALASSADATNAKSVSDRRELLTKQASEVVARLRRSGARRSDLAATQLRHSTFSALNLEVTGGTRKGLQPLSRQSIAELQSEWAASKAKRIAAEATKAVDSGASTASTMPSEEEVAESSQDEDVVAGTLSIKNMLRMRCSFLQCPVPAEISSLSAANHEFGWQKGDSPSLRGLTPTDGMHKASCTVTQLTRIQQLQRDVNSLLNKVCPESVAVITQRVASIQIKSAEELQVVIGLIFKKALAEPHYCETYADMVLALKQCMPEFPSPTGNKPITFKAALLNTTQSEFEALSQILTITAEESTGLQQEEIDTLRKKRRDRARGNMRFIGQLFLRALLGSRIIESIIKDLAKCEDANVAPEEAIVECLCELLQNTGYTLERSGEAGKASLSKVCDKLCAIKSNYSKRIQFGIQDVLDIRGAGWKKKTFKASAKTKEEIRREQEQDLWAQACGREVQSAEVQIAGARRPVAGW